MVSGRKPAEPRPAPPQRSQNRWRGAGGGAFCAINALTGHYVLRPLPSENYKVVFSIDFEEWFGEEFEEEESDGYPTEFWNDQTTLAGANSGFEALDQR